MELILTLKIIGAAVVSVVADIAGVVVVPVALMFTGPQADHLPKMFYWWDNHEAVYGINGGYAWKREYGDDTNTFWHRFMWTAIRNPAHNFTYYTLGVKDENRTLENLQDSTWDDVDTKGGFGMFVIHANGKKYPQIFFHNKWIYARIGWQWNSDMDGYCRFSTIAIHSKLNRKR